MLGGSQQLENLVRSKIDAEIQARITALGDGFAATHEEYREQVGFIKGLRGALSVIDTVAKDME